MAELFEDGREEGGDVVVAPLSLGFDIEEAVVVKEISNGTGGIRGGSGDTDGFNSE